VFDLLDAGKPSKPYMSRRLAVWGVLLGAFAMGLGVGKLLAGAKPFDWTLRSSTSSFFWVGQSGAHLLLLDETMLQATDTYANSQGTAATFLLPDQAES